MNQLLMIFFILGLIGVLALLPTFIFYIKSHQLGARIPFIDSLMMRMRKTLKKELIEAIAYSNHHQLNIDRMSLEAHYLASGNPLKCLEAMSYAGNKGLNLDFDTVGAMDLVGKDLIEAIDKTVETRKATTDNSKITISELLNI